MLWINQLMRQPTAAVIATAVVAYLLGCFSTGYYLVRWRTGQDIRKLGTGSTGARNVGRVVGRSGFLFTVLGDVAKGMAAVAIALWFVPDRHVALLALIAVVFGHLWPVQLGFHGGKGVATSLGALLIYSPMLTLCFLILFGLGYALLRKSLLPALGAYAVLPVAPFALHQDAISICGVCVLALLVIFAHHQNLSEEFHQLLRRTIDPKPKPPSTL